MVTRLLCVGGGDLLRLGEGALLLDAGALAREATQVVNAGAAHLTDLHHFDAFEKGAADWEDPLDADSGRHLANGEGFGGAFATALDNSALKDLGALLGGLLDL